MTPSQRRDLVLGAVGILLGSLAGLVLAALLLVLFHAIH